MYGLETIKAMNRKRRVTADKPVFPFGPVPTSPLEPVRLTTRQQRARQVNVNLTLTKHEIKALRAVLEAVSNDFGLVLDRPALVRIWDKIESRP